MSLIFDYLFGFQRRCLWIYSLALSHFPEAPLDSGFWILLLVELTLDASKCGVWILDFGFMDGETLIPNFGFWILDLRF